MRIDLPTPDAWLKICEQYRSQLPMTELPAVVQVYQGYGHAIWESIRGLAQLYSNRKTIVLIGPSEPIIEAVMKEFSSEGFAIKNISLKEAPDAATWLDPIQAEVLLTLWTNDDPISGRLFDHSVVDAILKEKRIFRISITHASRPLPTVKPNPFEVWIRSVTPERALLLAGERYRAQPVLAPKMAWTEASALIQFPSETDVQEMERAVRAFESSLPTGFKAYFQPTDARVFDRAVIYHPELDGSAIIERLSEKIHEPLAALGTDGPLETISPCRWQSPRMSAWLTQKGESEEVIRGLVILSERLVRNAILKKHLDEVAAEIISIQEG